MEDDGGANWVRLNAMNQESSSETSSRNGRQLSGAGRVEGRKKSKEKEKGKVIRGSKVSETGWEHPQTERP